MSDSLRLMLWTNIYTSNDLSGCSYVSVIYDTCKWLHEHLNGKFHAYLFVPPAESKAFIPDRYKAMDFVTTIPHGHGRIAGLKSHIPDDALKSVIPESSKYNFDLLMTYDMFVSYWFNFSLTKKLGMWYLPTNIPVIAQINDDIYEPAIQHLQPDVTIGREMVLATMMASQGCIVSNQDELKKCKRLAQEYLTPAKYMDVVKKLAVIPHAADFTELDVTKYDEARKKRWAEENTRNIFWGGSFESKKHLGAFCKGMDALPPELRHAFKFVVSSQTETDVKLRELRGDFRFNQSRQQYFQNMYDGDILIVSADVEVAGVGYFEAIASGMIPVVKKDPWIMERVGEDYPLAVKNPEKEFPAVLKWIHNNWDKAKGYANKARERVVSQVATENASRKLYEYLKPISEQNRSDCARKLFNGIGGKYFLQAIDQLPAEVEGYEKVQTLADEIAKLDGAQGVRKFPPLAMRWMMLEAGFEDHGGEPPRFKRK